MAVTIEFAANEALLASDVLRYCANLRAANAAAAVLAPEPTDLPPGYDSDYERFPGTTLAPSDTTLKSEVCNNAEGEPEPCETAESPVPVKRRSRAAERARVSAASAPAEVPAPKQEVELETTGGDRLPDDYLLDEIRSRIVSVIGTDSNKRAQVMGRLKEVAVDKCAVSAIPVGDRDAFLGFVNSLEK